MPSIETNVLQLNKQWLAAKQRWEDTKGELLQILYFDLFVFFILFHTFIYYGNQNYIWRGKN